MRVIEKTLYEFSELSEKAKQTAVEAYREKDRFFEYAWMNENIETLKKFCDIFDINLRNYNLGTSSDVYYSLNCKDEILNLSGIRLLKYIQNNFYNDISKPKWYNIKGTLSITDKPLRHKRIKSKILNSGPNKGRYYNSYYSAISRDYCCVLTGYCIDDDILGPIYDFIKKPDNTTFDSLIDDCIKAFEKAVEQDCEYQESDEYIIETIEANEYEFDEDGVIQ